MVPHSNVASAKKSKEINVTHIYVRQTFELRIYEKANILTNSSVSLFPGQFILNITVSSKCRKSCP